MTMKALDRQLNEYLKHRGQAAFPYPLQKVILARSMLRGALGSQSKRQLRAWLLRHITDPVYRESIQRTMP